MGKRTVWTMAAMAALCGAALAQTAPTRTGVADPNNRCRDGMGAAGSNAGKSNPNAPSGLGTLGKGTMKVTLPPAAAPKAPSSPAAQPKTPAQPAATKPPAAQPNAPATKPKAPATQTTNGPKPNPNAGPKGNQGLGNGVEPGPKGNGDWKTNDGPLNTPGNPGSKGGAQSQGKNSVAPKAAPVKVGVKK